MKCKNLLFYLVSFLILSVGMVSCSTYKHIAYFQDIPDDSSAYGQMTVREGTKYTPLTIQPGDVLQITVQTKMPEVSQDLGLPTLEGFTATDWLKSMKLGGGGGSNQSRVPAYKVDENGKINLPLMGAIAVDSLTVSEAKDKIKSTAAQFYKNPVVNVRLANFEVSVLGEVSNPGTYVMSQEKASLLDALGIAGDMTIYGKRRGVMLIREVKGQEKIVRFNMNSTDIFQSPYFYLRPGDVVYVEPTKGRALASDAPKLRFYSVMISTVSILVAILTRVL